MKTKEAKRSIAKTDGRRQKPGVAGKCCWIKQDRLQRHGVLVRIDVVNSKRIDTSERPVMI